MNITNESWIYIKNSWDVWTIENEHGDEVCVIKTPEVDDEDYQDMLNDRSERIARLIELAPSMYRLLVKNKDKIGGFDKTSIDAIESYFREVGE